MRGCGQQVRTIPHLLSRDWELDALASLDPGLDEGTNGVNVEEYHGGEDETEKIKDAWGDLSTDDLDVHPSGSGRVHEGSDIAVLEATTDLAPFGGKSATEFESEYTINTTEHLGVGNPKRTSRRWVNSVREISPR